MPQLLQDPLRKPGKHLKTLITAPLKKTEKMLSESIQALASLENLVGQVIRTVEEHGSDMYRQSDNFTNAYWETKWDFPGALLFSMTTLSFIGKNMVITKHDK